MENFSDESSSGSDSFESSRSKSEIRSKLSPKKRQRKVKGSKIMSKTAEEEDEPVSSPSKSKARSKLSPKKRQRKVRGSKITIKKVKEEANSETSNEQGGVDSPVSSSEQKPMTNSHTPKSRRRKSRSTSRNSRSLVDHQTSMISENSNESSSNSRASKNKPSGRKRTSRSSVSNDEENKIDKNQTEKSNIRENLLSQPDKPSHNIGEDEKVGPSKVGTLSTAFKAKNQTTSIDPNDESKVSSDGPKEVQKDDAPSVDGQSSKESSPAKRIARISPKRSNRKTTTKAPRPGGLDNIMSGVIFTISGFKNPERGEIRGKGLQMGAKYRPKYTKECTHVIAAFENTPKNQEAEQDGCKIVSREWIDDSFDKCKHRFWKTYRMDGKISDEEDEENDKEDLNGFIVQTSEEELSIHGSEEYVPSTSEEDYAKEEDIKLLKNIIKEKVKETKQKNKKKRRKKSESESSVSSPKVSPRSVGRKRKNSKKEPGKRRGKASSSEVDSDGVYGASTQDE